ncbi:MAG: NAD-dependent deacylase [Candidatus Omnitrophota bacterium]
MNEESKLSQAQTALENARSVFVITGAGISAESGVPTFRDAGGLWKKIDPYKVATPEAFAADPKFVWQWYDQRRTQLLTCNPNPAHEALALLERRKERYFLLTQNVDDLHEQAGSQQLSHVHGSIWELRCTDENVVSVDRRAPLPELPPRCPKCGGLLRPNVVWFGESIDAAAVDATERFLSQGEADVILVIGTEASFGYIAHWAMRARGAKGTIIEINLGETGFSSSADLDLRDRAGEILPRITSTQ